MLLSTGNRFTSGVAQNLALSSAQVNMTGHESSDVVWWVCARVVPVRESFIPQHTHRYSLSSEASSVLLLRLDRVSKQKGRAEHSFRGDSATFSPSPSWGDPTGGQLVRFRVGKAVLRRLPLASYY